MAATTGRHTSSRVPMRSKAHQLPVLSFWIETPTGGPDGMYLIPSSTITNGKSRKPKALGVGHELTCRKDMSRHDLITQMQVRTVHRRIRGCTPKPSKIPSNWISDFHSLVQPSFADIGSIFTATIPFVAEELRCGAGKPGTGRRRRKTPSNPQIMDSIRLDPEMLWQTA